MSISPNASYCSNESHNGIMEAVRAAENAGVLTVVAAGNDADTTSGCSVSDYGAYPDTLTVGGTQDVNDLTSLASVAIYPGSGSNTFNDTISIAHGDIVRKRMVDLVVTAYGDKLAGSGTVNDATNAPQIGTSVAAPQVAGAAGLLKDWAYDTGGTISSWRNNPYVLRVMLAAMGDGAYGSSSSGTINEIDERAGVGHLRFTLPSFIGSAGYWTVHWYTADDGDIFDIPVGIDSGPELATIKSWKFAALMDHEYYGTSPSMSFILVDKCPVGGGEVQLFNSVRTTHKGRLRLRASDMAEFVNADETAIFRIL